MTGGTAGVVKDLAKTQAKLGLEVAIYTDDSSRSGWSDLENTEIEIFGGGLCDLRADWQRPDLIHDHGIWLPGNHQCARFAVERKIRRIASPHGMLEPWALQHRKWKKRVAWHLYQRRDLQTADALHATAPTEGEQFRRMGLIPPIHVVPNGVHSPVRTSPTRRRKAGVKTALFLSRIHPKKGLPMLAKAWAQERPAGWKMQVVGPDENGHRATVEALVRKLGIQNEWSFEGRVEGAAKDEIFAGSDLFILPTYSENFGLAVGEALAFGIPVITTTGTPWADLRKHRCGWYVEPEVQALAAALRDAVDLEDGARAAMGARGEAWMRENFSWHAVTSRMINAYQQALEKA